MLLFLLSLVFAHNTAVAESEITLHNADDLIQFSKNVNSGTCYSGTTVFLGSDIDLAGMEFDPIGKYHCRYHSTFFLGTFDGQGHTISNLKVKMSFNYSYYSGLFGYSDGATIKNVILDGTCSIKSYDTVINDVYTGGVVGGFYATNGDSSMSNIVNMASVTFNGNIMYQGEVFLGGIVGHTSNDHNYNQIVRNCVNYGLVTQAGQAHYTYIGGIVGYAYKADLLNCLNYGGVIHSGSTTYDAFIGGIAGKIYGYSKVENCVNLGIITHNIKPDKMEVGAIAGEITYTDIHNCYWNDKIGYDVHGHTTLSYVYDSAEFNNNFILNQTVYAGGSITKSLIDALNACAEYNTMNYYSHWLLNKEEESITFSVNGNKMTSLESSVILLPNIMNGNGTQFSGWYTDSDCKKRLLNLEVGNFTELYGIYDGVIRNYTITFDTRGETLFVDPITTEHLAVVELPNDLSKEGYLFSCWETEAGYRLPQNYSMPDYNITLYAVWIPLRITSAEDLIEFSNAVNSGNLNSSKLTIYLGNDIVFTDELSEKFSPIGRNVNKEYNDNHFFGTFDGQGHVINGLKIRATGSVGLFGYSEGLTVRNVVMGSSCSVKNIYNPYRYYNELGSIIGYCVAIHERCIIENCVNKMDIDYLLTPGNINIGGVAGKINGNDYRFRSSVENCVNYGIITIRGDKYLQSIHVGGIVGDIYYAAIFSCTNYGDIAFHGTVKYSAPRLKGIAGINYETNIKNSKNHGKITNKSNVNVGAIVGYVFLGVALIAVVVVAVFAVRYIKNKNAERKRIYECEN